MPKPVTDTVQELLDEQGLAEIKNPNYLLNPRYDSDMAKDKRYPDHARNYTQLMTRTGSTEDALTDPSRIRQRSSVFRPSPYYELVPGMKNSVTNLKNPLYIDKEGHKLAYRPTGKHKNSSVKLYTSKYTKPGQFTFPRRKRFNEDVDKEIKSQRSQSRDQFATT